MAGCTDGLKSTLNNINNGIYGFYQTTKSCICNALLSMTFISFKGIYKVKQYFHKTLTDDVKLEYITEYESFNIHCYNIIQDNKIYVFNYLIPNYLHDKEKDILKNNVIKDTKDNIQTKEDNKKCILHASFVTETNDILCDITDELHSFKYYFNNDIKNDDMLYWDDLLHIIQIKYNRTIDKYNTYIYIILNDEELTEKTLLLSGIIHEHIRFKST